MLNRGPDCNAYLSSYHYDPWISWISHHIGVPDYTALSRRLSRDMTQIEKDHNVHWERAPEPSFEVAWALTTG